MPRRTIVNLDPKPKKILTPPTEAPMILGEPVTLNSGAVKGLTCPSCKKEVYQYETTNGTFSFFGHCCTMKWEIVTSHYKVNRIL